MQFGIGILGRGWSPEKAIERALENTLPPGRNMHLHVGKYSAKLAAESMLADPPCEIDLCDDALVTRLAQCSRPARPSEIGMIRDAYLVEYRSHLGEKPAEHEHVWRRHQNVTSSGFKLPPYEVCEGCDAAREVKVATDE